MTVHTDALPPAGTARTGAARFPLALAGGLLAMSALSAVVAARALPAQLPALEWAGFWAQWLCGVALMVGVAVALASAWVGRRGAPRRVLAAVAVAVVAYFALSTGLSLLRTQWLLQALQDDPDGTRALLRWLPLVAPLQMLLVSVASLALAGWAGGRGAAAVQWRAADRRLLGVLVAFGACSGVLPLFGQLLSATGLLPGEAVQNGLPFLALAVGAVHGALWALAPVRHGAGTLPALASSLLVGPLLLAFGAAATPLLERLTQPGVAPVIAATLLLAAPVAAWALCRGLHRRIVTPVA